LKRFAIVQANRWVLKCKPTESPKAINRFTPIDLLEMKYILVSGLIATTCSLVFPILQNDQDFDVDGGFDIEKVISRTNPWEKPLSADSVAPCPFLNSARNHGLLPRSGRNITTDEIYNLLANVAGLDVSISNFLIEKVMDIGYTNEQGQKVLDFDSLQK